MAAPPPLDLEPLRGLQSVDQMELLDIVDSLRAEGLGEITALPQLIVCGDQSSGKSSVLEAVSGIPFPRHENLCTRFATEVVLRRGPKTEINVSISPSRERTIADYQRLKQYRHELSTQEDFPKLFRDARDAILGSAGNSFSKDVLRIELTGPNQPQLTLVDLPGLIHSHTASQKLEDVEIVSSLVTSYLENPRSIILAVVSAKYDTSLQIILKRARDFDPHGTRTLGIITNPDIPIPGSKTEEAIMKLARNEVVEFRLGWHVVRNLDLAKEENAQATMEKRDAEEKAFFRRSNFGSLRAHTTGISALRTRLSKVLFDQIRQELPRLVHDIETKVSLSRADLEKLGPSRENLHEQQGFLIRLSQSFQTICQAAVRGDYDHEFFQVDDSPERRLCAELLNRHFDFAADLRSEGAKWLIVDSKEGQEVNPFCRTREEAITEACKLLRRSRGRELPGLPNYLLIGELFREYSQPWEDLARRHIENIWEATNCFLDLVLDFLADDQTHEKIIRLWLRPLMKRKLDMAYSNLDDLIEVHKDFPFTCNHHFLDNRRKLHQKKGDEELQQKLDKEFSKPNQKLSVDDVTRIVSTLSITGEIDMDMIAAEDAFDNMNAYYEVAMNLFMDNVPTLAIQAPIIRRLYEMLSPTAVYNDIGSDIIAKIAGESEEKMELRKELQSRLATLEAGARICRQYALRPQSTLESTPLRGQRDTVPGQGGDSGSPSATKNETSTKRPSPWPNSNHPTVSPQKAASQPSSQLSLVPGQDSPASPSLPSSTTTGSWVSSFSPLSPPASQNKGKNRATPSPKPVSQPSSAAAVASSSSAGGLFANILAKPDNPDTPAPPSFSWSFGSAPSNVPDTSTSAGGGLFAHLNSPSPSASSPSNSFRGNSVEKASATSSGIFGKPFKSPASSANGAGTSSAFGGGFAFGAPPKTNGTSK